MWPSPCLILRIPGKPTPCHSRSLAVRVRGQLLSLPRLHNLEQLTFSLPCLLNSPFLNLPSHIRYSHSQTPLVRWGSCPEHPITTLVVTRYVQSQGTRKNQQHSPSYLFHRQPHPQEEQHSASTVNASGLKKGVEDTTGIKAQEHLGSSP